MTTLLLDPDTWDLKLDTKGHIALAATPYARVQNVASACRLFRGELWYNKRRGIPYFETILGKQPASNYVKLQIEKMAKSVAGVVSAKCVVSSMAGRNLTGQIQLKLIDNPNVVSVGL